ncbi:adenylyltransferase/cytidyltransferase family protein [Shewanella sp. SP1S1-7]|jgi:glycerol-3-phosphate cytidylyltransferase|uniref:Glycerol-3-phosphate cytidylyltransferase n=1 Tax=Shewanella baltica (strain OS155 / ATCC BAA-1091) TaxID=325240 RepID=A3D501_SHEB5|nr:MULTISPECIES: adenylyltransferase/cytidyltransferase family protein [Shewanella]ABN61814.1 Glycerol-3-phosphate cytidylyltransferase [Shewanella baltica OS155]AEH14164.1 cytidyltransferase-related domain protein [Shewanella baltica OS117]MDT3337520.1 adenylyltransferase/cytidyltransferase family protein [Shewanella sp. SP1S1-7]
MKSIITYGTYDLFHYGHVRLFQRLKAMGDKLIVGVSTDEFNSLKGKVAFFNYQQRIEMISACKYVDLVIPETHWQQKAKDIVELNVNIFGMGSDWQGKFDYLKEFCQVIYLERTDAISTTEIKTNLAVPRSNSIRLPSSALIK